jgi:thiol-disulfide isomerase/thioredoxin
MEKFKKGFGILFFLSIICNTNAQTVVPNTISGNWLTKYNVLKYRFNPGFAIIDGIYYQYKKIKSTRNRTDLYLTTGRFLRHLSICMYDSTTIAVCSKDKSLKGIFYKNRNSNPDFNYGSELRANGIKKTPGIFHLNGLIENYIPNPSTSKYVKIQYLSLISVNEMTTVLAELDKYGRFKTDISLYFPQQILLEIANVSIKVIGKPNSGLTIVANVNYIPDRTLSDENSLKEQNSHILFGGKEALINTEINFYEPHLYQIFPVSLNDKLVDSLDKAGYKTSRIKIMNEQIQNLNSNKANHFDQRFLTYMRNSISYSAGDDLLRYLWLKPKNKKRLVPDKEYLSFLSAIPLNNIAAVGTDSYNLFLRDWLLVDFYLNNTAIHDPVNIQQIIIAAKTAGFTFKSNDEDFLIKYYNLKADKNPQAFLKFSADKKSTIDSMLDLYNTALDTGLRRVGNQRHQHSMNEAINIAENYDHNGIGSAILKAKLLSFNYTEDGKVFSKAALSAIKREYNSDNGEYILNERKKGGPENQEKFLLSKMLYDLNTALTTKLGHGDDFVKKNGNPGNPHKSLLDSLIIKYKGNVIYIDFWAPWCQPCIHEMPDSKRLQKEYKGKKVIFIYLALKCSEASWRQTIKALDISGVNYLLTNDDFLLLSEKFNISYIPHYVLISPLGAIINDNAPPPSNFQELFKQINLSLKDYP